MHHVNQLLEQDEVTGDCSDARTNHDTVESLLFEPGRDNSFRSLAKVGEAEVGVVTAANQKRIGLGETKNATLVRSGQYS